MQIEAINVEHSWNRLAVNNSSFFLYIQKIDF